ncbi:Holliday junction resolvase [Candidatus Woesearchaeota archaeon CG10_big_fil_rev_8_21_14_0_10_30_7]|nr:MAG: Holliday junction resolvase [Candidatus Woesearchaeota archaeon CG10_big_fil_rev_8_21_14_0_10_30_7]
MNRKLKGTTAERDLVHKFWALNGWVACRIAGSGSMRYPSPDIIAGNYKKCLAIECKNCSSDIQYLTKKEISELLHFADKLKAEPWIAVKFSSTDWIFIHPVNLKKTDGENYAIKREERSIWGKTMEELIN